MVFSTTRNSTLWLLNMIIFRFWPAVSRPGPFWNGYRGYVQPYVLEAVGDRRDLDVYICGLKEMVNEVRGTLLELGFDRKRLIYEKYD